MNAIICYFSATGNSLKIAKDLALELGRAKVAPIAKSINTGGEQGFDTVVIVYPVYMFGIPLIVADFLKALKITQGAYVCGVATFAGLTGRCHSLSKKLLKKRGIELAAGFSVRMPGNYTPLCEAIPQERQQELFKKAELKIKEIADLIRQKKRGIMEEKPFLLNFLLYSLLYKVSSTQILGAAKGFWVTDACTKCGLCAKVCPVVNIKMADGKPVWLDHCQHCMACLQWCPVEAIQYKKSTSGKKRYHHPDITSQDIMGQAA